jgi:hypothetical protein
MITAPQQEAMDAMAAHGQSPVAAARALGISRGAMRSRLAGGARWQDADPAIIAACEAGGISDPATLGHFWKLAKDGDGNGYSLFVKNPNTGENVSFADMVKKAIAEGYDDGPLPYEPRKAKPSGDRLLVVDLADVHFGKLCVATQTGYEYNREVARHRVKEGTKELLRKAQSFGFGRILYVMGNDILHTEDGKATTRGTAQDSDGTFFQMFSDAKAAVTESIKACAAVADVDLIHCMSNHDNRAGWMLSQTVAAGFDGWPSIRATPYNMSENHRKYYGFENSAFMVTHGDGAKEEKLYALMVQEARALVGSCPNLYVLMHHFHHKIRKRRGADVFTSEKDHTGMTVITTGAPNVEGSALQIEYVRSPSAPDNWHHENGFVNRQAVECFIYHPHDGQEARFTAWF